MLKDLNRNSIIDQYFAQDISNQNFQKALFNRVSAIGKKFTNVDFRFCIFENCYFRNCAFDSCLFEGSKFNNSSLAGSSFSGCKFDYSTFNKTL